MSWLVGEVKFYDPSKKFGFARDLTVPDYTEKDDDIYLGSSVSAKQELVEGTYISFKKVPSSKKPGTFKADDVHLLLDHPGQTEPLLEKIADPSEREEVEQYLKSDRARWHIGKVKFFDSQKGFGFIKPVRPPSLLKGEDAYVNEHQVMSRSLRDDSYVAFRLGASRKPGEYQAMRVQVLSEFPSPEQLQDDLAFWMLGGSSIRVKVSPMARIVPQSSVSALLGFVKRIARAEEERPARKRGTALRLLGKALEEAIEANLLPSDWLDRAWAKYDSEVQRLVAEDALPGRVESLLWLEGLVKKLPAEKIDEMLSTALRGEDTGNEVDLSFDGWSPLSSIIGRNKSRIETRKVVNRLSTKEVIRCVQRHVIEVKKTIRDDAGDVEDLKAHRKLLEAVREGHQNSVAEALNDYAGAISELAGQLYRKKRLTDQQVFSFWSCGLLEKISSEEFLAGYTQTDDREERTELLDRLSSEQRDDFCRQRTTELVRAYEDGDEQKERLYRWLRDVRLYSESVDCDADESATASLWEGCQDLLAKHAEKRTQVVLYADGYLDSPPMEWLKQTASSLQREEFEHILKRTDADHAVVLLNARLADLQEIVESADTSESIVPQFGDSFDESAEYVEARWLLNTAGNALPDSPVSEFESHLVDAVDLRTHVDLFQNGVLTLSPEAKIRNYLKAPTHQAIKEAQTWVEDGVFPSQEFAETLRDFTMTVSVKSRPTAHAVQAAARYLQVHRPGLADVSDVTCSTSACIIRMTHWLYGEEQDNISEHFDLSLMQNGLVWLSEQAQVRALRKALHLHRSGNQKLAPQDLIACSTYEPEGNEESELPTLGLSAELIIQAVRSAASTGEFPSEKELLNLVWHITSDDPRRQLHIQDIFNRCEGRADYKFNSGKANGERSSSDLCGLVEKVV